MKMRIISVLLVISQIAMAQDIDECRKVVDLTIEAINNQSIDQLKVYLSNEFSIAGQTGEIAIMVLTQLIAQLGETVSDHTEKEQIHLENGFELKYDINYQNMGVKESSFVFNKNNQLTELTLFKMEVKKMCSEAEVNIPENEVIRIPFELAGNLISVNAILNGENKTFLLDSGSPKSIVNSKHLTKNDEDRKTISSVKGVNGNISDMNIEMIAQLDFGGIQINNEEVITMDLSHLEEELEIDVHGLIGYDMIKEYDLIFDYEELSITLIKPNHFEEYNSENLNTFSLQTVPFDLEGHIPVIETTINNESYSFGIDCGAESNLMDDDLFDSLKESIKDIGTEELVGADGAIKNVQEGQLENIKIGDKAFHNMITLFSDISHLNEAYKIKIDGLMGCELLSKQKTLISYTRKELVFIQ